MSGAQAAAPDAPQFEAILAAERELLRGRWMRLAVLALIVVGACEFTGLFDPARLAEGLPAIAKIGGEMMPPDFTRWQAWLRPLLDTLAMSVAGTFMAIMLSLPLAVLAASTTTPNAAVYRVARFALNLLRAIPELIMGILLVAAVGFGASMRSSACQAKGTRLCVASTPNTRGVATPRARTWSSSADSTASWPSCSGPFSTRMNRAWPSTSAFQVRWLPWPSPGVSAMPAVPKCSRSAPRSGASIIAAPSRACVP
jgi:hypothetical protein